jgi:predicted RND superfamily exporter protein
MKQCFIWCRDHPLFVLLPLVILTLFFGYHALHIRLDTSTQSMTVPSDPARLFYEQTIATFGTDNITIVYVKDPNIFTHPVLTAVESVFYALQDIPGVTRVDGLFNTTNFKGEDGTLTTMPFLDGMSWHKSKPMPCAVLWSTRCSLPRTARPSR